jgi:hypothetical protein
MTFSPGFGFEFFVRGKRHPKVLPRFYINHRIRVAHNLLPCLEFDSPMVSRPTEMGRLKQ